MGVISSQEQSLLSLDISSSDVTDSGLVFLKGCSSLQSLKFNYCDQISEHGLENISGLLNLTSLSFKKSNGINAGGMKAFTSLVNLVSLDLERCLGIHGGLVYLKDFKNLRSLGVCGGSITDAGVKNIKELASLALLYLSQNGNLTDKTLELISGLTALVSLNVSNSCITKSGLHHLKPLKSLRSLSLESCKVTATEMKKLQLAALPSLVNNWPE